MIYNRKTFFDYARKSVFSGSMRQSQVDGLNLLLSEGERRGTEINDLAYIIATALHETAYTVQPIEEYGRGRGRKYGIKDPETGKTYYGRGYVQLTWKYNYEKASRKLGVDFVNNPELVMNPKYAIHILFVGMQEGWFTGKTLDSYIDDIDEGDDEDLREYMLARYIVNGKDKREKIAQLALNIEKALRASWQANVEPIATSRTVQGAGVGVGGGSLVLVQEVQEVGNKLEQHKEALSTGDFIGIAIAAVVVLGSLYALYARWDDAGRPLPWRK